MDCLAGRVPDAVVRPPSGAILVRHLRPGARVGFRPLRPEPAPEELGRLRRRLFRLSKAGSESYWNQVVPKLQFGSVSERVFWAIHERLLQGKRSVIRIPDVWMATRVWGSEKRPRHWRKTLCRAHESLCWLHLGAGSEDCRPDFGAETAVLTHAADLRGSPNDQCDVDCPLLGGPPHHHFLVNIGRGLLGVLEAVPQVRKAERAIMSSQLAVRGLPAKVFSNSAKQAA